MEPYRTLFPDVAARLPETEKLVRRVPLLPTGTSVGPVEIRQVCHIIRFALEHCDELKERMTEQTAVKASSTRR